MVKVKQELADKISSNEATIGVIGLGNIGLSLVEVFGNSLFPIVGYDTDVERVKNLYQNISYTTSFIKNIPSMIERKQFKPSSDPEILKDADILVISVPTSLDEHDVPDLSNINNAIETVSTYLAKGKLVILQSSVYPGLTEEHMLPRLEQSRLKVGEDFYVAYVPEMTNFGDINYTFSKIPRLISGVTPSCLEITKQLYQKITDNMEICSSPKVAEAAKLLQNSYRLVNISMINELKVLFELLDLDVWDVIKAASCKPFGFTPFFPSPGIGGDCIPVDPVYLAWQAKLKGGITSIIDRALEINQIIPHFVVLKIIEGLNLQNKSVFNAKVLILGVAYKKDMNDIRQSASLRILSLLKKHGVQIHYNDPFVKEISNLKKFPDLHLQSESFEYEKLGQYDAVVITTDHSIYDWPKIIMYSPLIIDCHNVTTPYNQNGNPKIIKG